MWYPPCRRGALAQGHDRVERRLGRLPPRLLRRVVVTLEAVYLCVLLSDLRRMLLVELGDLFGVRGLERILFSTTSTLG